MVGHRGRNHVHQLESSLFVYLTQEVVVRALRCPLDIAPNVEVEFLGTFSKNVFKEA
jgi:hypothetical protein